MKRTLKEASEVLGITVKALRYRIKAQDLEPEMEEGQHGRRYVLNDEQMALLSTVPSATDEEGIESLCSSKRYRDYPQEGPEDGTEDSPEDGTEDAQYRLHRNADEGKAPVNGGIPLSVYKSTQEALREALRVSREQREDRLEAERKAEEAQEAALRMARQVQALMQELNSQRNLLSENAESIVQREAKIKEAEAQRQGVEALLKTHEDERNRALAEAKEMREKLQEAEVEIEKARTEFQSTTEKLKEARTELAGWEEQRQNRPFWKKWFSKSG